MDAYIITGYVHNWVNAWLNQRFPKKQLTISLKNDIISCSQVLRFSRPVKTTGLAGGLHRPYKGLRQQRLKAYEKVRQSQKDYWLPPSGGGFLFAFAYWLTRKRVSKFLQADLVRGYVFL